MAIYGGNPRNIGSFDVPTPRHWILKLPSYMDCFFLISRRLTLSYFLVKTFSEGSLLWRWFSRFYSQKKETKHLSDNFNVPEISGTLQYFLVSFLNEFQILFHYCLINLIPVHKLFSVFCWILHSLSGYFSLFHWLQFYLKFHTLLFLFFFSKASWSSAPKFHITVEFLEK